MESLRTAVDDEVQLLHGNSTHDCVFLWFHRVASSNKCFRHAVEPVPASVRL
jgi:hypothetical protein